MAYNNNPICSDSRDFLLSDKGILNKLGLLDRFFSGSRLISLTC